MDQNIAPADPADAAAAFEALRREVALLNVALAGLAAERASMPDYSETLGEIAQGVRAAVARMGKLASSAALALTPAEVAQQIVAAGDAARRQDRAAVHQAQEALQRAASDLRDWVNSARLASIQNRRLVLAASTGLIAGALLGVWGPGVVARAMPDRWLWPEKMAARVLDRDLWSAGERMLAAADPPRWRAITLRATQASADKAGCARGARQKSRPEARGSR